MQTLHPQHSSTKEKGAALMISILFFVIASTFVIVGVAGPVSKDIRTSRALVDSKVSYALAEGASEEIAVRILHGLNYSGSELLSSAQSDATSTVVTNDPFITITSQATTKNAVRSIELVIADGFHEGLDYGVQTDNGGIYMENSSVVHGNVYSNGPIVADGNTINGDVTSAGPAGLIDNVTATGSAWGATVQDSSIEGNIYAENVSGNTLTGGGTSTYMATYRATTSLPLTDGILSLWKNDATSTLVWDGACPLVINSSTTTGPMHVPCDMEISGNPTVNVDGVIWVEGDLDILNNPLIQVDNSETAKAIPFIVDNPADRANSGKVYLNNNSAFAGAGSNSYILIISRNESVGTGPNDYAIRLRNGGDGDLLLYAGWGELRMENNTSLNEATANTIRMQNFSEVFFESGLENLIVTTGVPGAYTFYRIQEVE